MRMMLEALPPGVEDHETANRRAHAFRSGRDLQQRRRHREDEVHVADGQELLLPRGHPGVTGGREALGTMAIPTAVVREGRLRTLVAAIAVPAQCRGSTLGDGPEDAPMLSGHP